MERRQFLEKVTAPVTIACLSCMGMGCSKSANNSNNTNSTTPPSNVNITINLNSQLTTVGSSVAQNGVIVVRLASTNVAGSFVAVQESCPHQGVSIAFFANSSTFICPSHGAVFNTAGSNIGGQQTGALKVYAISISGSTLTVTG
ncbi:MAG: Rieske 2Fe-2S domain-containing protein [Chitinophagia bacterium]|jgi:Rieske Fe-S protein